MENIFEAIKNIKIEQITDIVIGILIFILFKCLSKSLSFFTIKIFKPRKNKKEIKNNAFYKPLIILYTVIGLYIAILLIKRTFSISDEIFEIVNKILKIVSIILIANGLANSFTTKSKTVNKIKEKVNPDIGDKMYGYILKAIRILIYIFAGYMVISELGYDLSGLVAGLGIGSVVITLAAQDTAKNIFGGMMLLADKTFEVGDWIEVDKYEGTVEDITFRSTRVRTFNNSVVNIPNSVIANASIINWSRMEQRRNKVNLCLELNTPLEKVQIVQKRIKEVLMQHDDVIDDTIIVRFDNITDNGINLLVNSYTNSVSYPSFLEEKEKINYTIMQILKEENVELAYDTKTVFLKNNS